VAFVGAVTFLSVSALGVALAGPTGETPTTVPRSGLAVKGVGVALIVAALLIAPALSVVAGRFMRRRKGRLTWWQRIALILFPVVVLAGALTYLVTMVRIPDLDALRAAIPQYQAVNGAPVGDAYLQGRVVVIQQYGEDLHHIFTDLPEDLKAYVPEEVGTVIAVACYEDVRGYQHSIARTTKICNSSSCDVRVIDWTLPAVLVEQDFSTYGCADRLDGAMLEYLLSLPRRVG
jgi:hypothetical protein